MSHYSRYEENFKIILLIQLALLLLDVYGLNTNRVHKEQSEADDKSYFAIATMPNTSYSRVFNKTLMNLTQNLFPTKKLNFDLDTLTIELPANGSFSALFLRELCVKLEKKRVLAVFVIGDSPAAFTINMAATYIGIPVLWARGHSGFSPGFRSLVSNY
ncbi:hypothetical protein HHI36_007253 [Cryptolaemus montrouzieri]|uniref:Receptor ligand binding region domain-containing protein n=1 Tax=Cryptolaemus montrouzieri TaxID=559131 RepID=A0ABD2MP00_9CUCU